MELSNKMCCYYYGIFSSFLSAFQPVKDESGALPVVPSVIHPSDFYKMWAVPSMEIFWISETFGRPGINSTPLMKFFSRRNECSYDHRVDLGFQIPRPVNFDLQILVLYNFFSIFKRDVFIVRKGTSISKQVLDFLSWMTTSGLLAEICRTVVL